MLSSQVSLFNSNLRGFVRAMLAAMLLGSVILPCRVDAAGNAPVASTGVRFDGFVNWDFQHRMKLNSWKTTAIVIQKTLAAWYPRHAPFSLMENGSPEEFEGFLHALPGEKNCDISVVYLASHQSPVAEWDFTQRRYLTLRQALQDTPVPPHKGRVVILDACYAAAAQHRELWRKFAPVTLYASSDSEETPDINFHSKRLGDFARQYPMAYTWLKKNLGWGWDGRISFLGFVWVQTWLTTKNAPATMGDWVDFFQRCEETASEYNLRNMGRPPVSKVTASIPRRETRSTGKPPAVNSARAPANP